MEINITLRPGKPCHGCREDTCDQELCRLWQDWFMQGWAAVNRFAWKQMDDRGKNRFTYELPHLEKSPCTGCPCGAWCDTPCSQRLRWWDLKMAAIRGRMKNGTDTQAAAVR